MYKKIRNQHLVETLASNGTCKIIWKQKVLPNVQFFGWLLSIRSYNMSIPKEAMSLDNSAEGIMCIGGEEDCSHLFIHWPFAKAIWDAQKIPQVDNSSKEAF